MWSYEINFEKSDVRWASRWNVYLEMSDVNIHWFSVINSVVVVFFLAGQHHSVSPGWLLHFARVVDDAKFIVVTRSVCVCLSVRGRIPSLARTRM